MYERDNLWNSSEKPFELFDILSHHYLKSGCCKPTIPSGLWLPVKHKQIIYLWFIFNCHYYYNCKLVKLYSNY